MIQLSEEESSLLNNKDEKPELKVCFVIPASPTSSFYSQVAMFRLTLDSLGGVYRKSSIVLSLGDETVKPIPETWSFHLGANTLIHWAEPNLFRVVGQRAQGDNRWKQDYDGYDVVVFSDADTILLKSIDEVLHHVKDDDSVAGVVAHYPFPHERHKRSGELWRYYATRFSRHDISLDYRYTLLETFEDDDDAKCPFYVNFGFVVMSPRIMKKIRNSFLDIRSEIAPLLTDTRFSGQIALTLALCKHDVPVRGLEMKYNFPNDPVADRLYQDQLNQICVLHYLRTDKFDRQKIFTTEKAFNEFLHLDLQGSNKIFQQHIQSITHGCYPFGQLTTNTENTIIDHRMSILLLDRIRVVFGYLSSLLARPVFLLRDFRGFLLNLSLLKASDYFDPDWYLAQNPDIARAKVNPFVHYLNYGGFEGRDPSPKFSSQFYLDENQDVKKARANPLIHYLRYGKAEGRIIQSSKET